MNQGFPTHLRGGVRIRNDRIQAAGGGVLVALALEDGGQGHHDGRFQGVLIQATVFLVGLGRLFGVAACQAGDCLAVQLPSLVAGSVLGFDPSQHQERLQVVGIAFQHQPQRLFPLAVAHLGTCRLGTDLQVALLDGPLAQLEKPGQDHAGDHPSKMGPMADHRGVLPSKLANAARQVRQEKQADDHQRIEPDLEADGQDQRKDPEDRHGEDHALEVAAHGKDPHDAGNGARGAQGVPGLACGQEP